MLDKYDSSSKQFHLFSIVEYKNSQNIVYVKMQLKIYNLFHLILFSEVLAGLFKRQILS